MPDNRHCPAFGRLGQFARGILALGKEANLRIKVRVLNKIRKTERRDILEDRLIEAGCDRFLPLEMF